MKTIISFIILLLAGHAWLPATARAQEDDPAEVAVGERLFLETRFAQWFYAHATDVNGALPAGDPVLDVTVTTAGPLPGPFRGRSMNCRTCHLVDEHTNTPGAGNRTYADFARRSPVPVREDGQTTTTRNSPALVGAAPLGRRGRLLHFDGEFASTADLVAATLTGRNFGWRPGEHGLAVAHVANVIRGDDGRGALAREFGGPYRAVLRGAAQVPGELRLPAHLRIDVDRASDEEILRAVARLVAIYVTSLEFARDLGGTHGTPFDVFLERNGWPRQLHPGQSQGRYSRTLRARVVARHEFEWVGVGSPRRFALHDQFFRFGPDELRGLRIFLRTRSEAGAGRGGAGNCVACHPLPTFTDFAVHNTGVTQREYDAVHGTGHFAALSIPDLSTRNSDPDRYLPATGVHPDAAEPFRRPPRLDVPEYADLGLWNMLQNPDFLAADHQRRLAQAVCRAMGDDGCRRAAPAPAPLLEGAIAVFKTPGLRDLGHSAPYFHDGSADTLEEAVQFYVDTSEQARAGLIRNAAPELSAIDLVPEDVEPLAAFLRALNEDYE